VEIMLYLSRSLVGFCFPIVVFSILMIALILVEGNVSAMWAILATIMILLLVFCICGPQLLSLFPCLRDADEILPRLDSGSELEFNQELSSVIVIDGEEITSGITENSIRRIRRHGLGNDVELVCKKIRLDGSGKFDALACAICLEEVEDEQLVSELPCTHVYHSDCIRKWLKRRMTCPLCNENLIRNGNSNTAENSDRLQPENGTQNDTA